MQCPACEDRLSRVDYDGIAVGRCESCKGTWLSGTGFASVTQMDGSGFSPRDVAKLRVLLEYKVSKSVKPTDHPCPRCRKSLRARNYANIAGFFIEQCPGGCGVWVREGDLDRIRILRSLGRSEKVRTRAPKKAAATAKAAAAPGKAVPVAGKGAKARKRARRKTVEEHEPLEAAGAEAPPRKPGFLARLLARFFGRT